MLVNRKWIDEILRNLFQYLPLWKIFKLKSQNQGICSSIFKNRLLQRLVLIKVLIFYSYAKGDVWRCGKQSLHPEGFISHCWDDGTAAALSSRQFLYWQWSHDCLVCILHFDSCFIWPVSRTAHPFFFFTKERCWTPERTARNPASECGCQLWTKVS